MCVGSLYNYIVDKTDFLEDFTLFDTTLVVDGLSLVWAIWVDMPDNSRRFGGDYNNYSEKVTKFFQNLLQCKVRPLVVFSGGSEKKECITSPTIDYHDLPLLSVKVFLEVMKQMKIKTVQCLYQAYNTIVTLANKLQCPVLTMDPGFFLSDLPGVVLTKSITFGKEAKCKIYRVEKLLNAHKGLILANLPLTYVINDQNIIARDFGWKRYKINGAFAWLSNYSSSDSAITAILGKIKQAKRDRALAYIQNTQSTYAAAQCIKRVLKHFGLSNGHQQHYSVKEDDGPIKELPNWFIDEFLAGNISSYYMNMMVHHTYIPEIPIELHPNLTCETSMPFIKRIYELLLPYDDYMKDYELHIVIKRQFNQFDRKKLTIKKSPIHHLDHFRDNISEEKIIMIHYILGVPMINRLTELPNNWRLYMIAIMLWKRRISPKKFETHLNALLWTMLIGIIDKKLGECDALEVLCTHSKYYLESKNTDSKEESRIIQALNSVTQKECMIASSFIYRRSLCDKSVFITKYDINTIHMFNIFQNDLMNTMDLNTLLGYPYAQPMIGEHFNGTILHNMYVDLSEHSDSNAYIRNKFKIVPHLFQVFEMMKDIFMGK